MSSRISYASSVVSLVNVVLVGSLGLVCIVVPRQCLTVLLTFLTTEQNNGCTGGGGAGDGCRGGYHYHDDVNVNVNVNDDSNNDDLLLLQQLRTIATCFISVAGVMQVSWSLCLFLNLYYHHLHHKRYTTSTDTGEGTSNNRSSSSSTYRRRQVQTDLYSNTSSVQNLYIAIIVQVVTGLVWMISSGLCYYVTTLTIDHDHDDIYNSRNLLLLFGLSISVGFVVFGIGCLSFLISVWPTTTAASSPRSDRRRRPSASSSSSSPPPSTSPTADLRSDSTTTDSGTRQSSSLLNDNLLEPLLPQHRQQEQLQQEEEDIERSASAARNDLEQTRIATEEKNQDSEDRNDDDPRVNMGPAGDNVETNQDSFDGSDSSSSSTSLAPTSRIQGTRRLFQLAHPHLVYLYIGCVVLLVRLPFSLAIPHFVSTAIGALSQSQFDRARTEIYWLFMLGTVDALLDFGCIFFFGLCDLRIVRGVRIDTFAAILRQEVAFFDNHTTGELSSRLTSDCGMMASDLTWFFRFSIESVVRITGITTYMFIRSPKLGAVALSIVPVIAAVNKVYGQWLSDNARKVQDALAAANSVSQESLACIRTVVAFASENLELSKYVEKIDEQFRLNVRQIYFTGIYYMFVSTFLINTVVQGVLLLIGSYMIQWGDLTSEVLLAFMLYQGQLQNEMMNLFNSYSSLIKSTGAGDKVFELLDRKPPPPATGSNQVLVEDDEEEGNVEEEGDETENSLAEAVNDSVTPMRIEFKNVNFFYPSRGPHNMVLKGFDLVIPESSTLALVGPSGCGKSTIISLCERFYDPTSGYVLIDGEDIRTIDIKKHRRRIGVVTQDPTLFSGTIMENILYGSPDPSTTKAMEAAKQANADQFIRSFPQGYDTSVGEKGVLLSGGQKQRIAISRAIRRHPSLLLLDEATSALDPDSENIVQKSIDDLLKTSNGITTIIVAHRLRTVRNADMIAVINDGRIVEIGPHEKLMGITGGYYAGMVAKSTGGKLAE